MSQKSTEQVLREALQEVVEQHDYYGDWKDPRKCEHALAASREALALPDSGDHEIAEAIRAQQEIARRALNRKFANYTASLPTPESPQPDAFAQVQRLLDEEITNAEQIANEKRKALKGVFRDRTLLGTARQLGESLAALGERRASFILLQERIAALAQGTQEEKK